MISCTVVGGSPALEFSKFIESNSGGSIVIDNVFNTFSSDSASISRGLIRTKKMIWLINESNNLKGDLAVIDECFRNPTYFRVEQFYIFGVRDESTTECEKIFKMLMIEHDFSSYKIYLKEKLSSYSTMYSELMGTTEDKEVVTVRRKIYRVSNSDASKRGYDPEEFNKNLAIEETDNSAVYEEIKKAARKTETNRIIKDVPEKPIPKIDLNISNIDIASVKYRQNIFIVCGKPKAGSSVLATNLTQFLIDRGDNVNVVDITPNFGCARMCISKLGASKSNNKRILVNSEDLLTGREYNNKSLAVFSPSSLSNRSLLAGYLKYVLSIPNRTSCDYLVIDCCLDDIKEVIDICGSRIGRIFIAVPATREELIIARGKIKEVTYRKIEHVIFLNKYQNFDKSTVRITEVDAKGLIPDGKFTGYVNFEKEEADFSQLVKVGGV